MTSISSVSLTGSRLRTYGTIFQHPVSPNLDWRHGPTRFRHLEQVEGPLLGTAREFSESRSPSQP